MGLHVEQIAVGGYDKNFSYLIYDEDTRNTCIVDPSGDLEAILQTAEEQELDLVGVLLTHTHTDHFDKLDELLRSYAIPVHVHENGKARIVSQSPVYAMRDKDTLMLGAHQLTVMYTPGHIDDAVCFYIDGKDAADGIPKVITGDTLFVEGCGKTNKENVRFLFNSLIRLKALPSDTVVYPGHDYGTTPTSTIGSEKEQNQYLSTNDFDTFKKLRLG